MAELGLTHHRVDVGPHLEGTDARAFIAVKLILAESGFIVPGVLFGHVLRRYFNALAMRPAFKEHGHGALRRIASAG